MSQVESIRLSADNVSTFVLMSGGEPMDLTPVTRVVIDVDDDDGTVLDSAVLGPMVMWWDESAEMDCDGTDLSPLQLKGSHSGLTPGFYRDCEVRLYSKNSEQGIVFPDPITLVVGD